MLPLTHIFRETVMGYQLEMNGEWSKSQPPVLHGRVKLYGKNDKELDSVWQCSEDIKMEFGILKCAIVSLQRGRKKGGKEFNYRMERK